MHLLLPRTDWAIVVEVIVVIAIICAAFSVVRRHRELRLLVAGIGMFVLALMALRALH